MKIRKGVSTDLDAKDAVKSLHQQISQKDIKLVIFFCSPKYDLNILAQTFNQTFPYTQVIGCTTAGEITPLGYLHGSLTGVSFAGSDFDVVVTCLEDLESSMIPDIGEQVIALKQSMLDKNINAKMEDMFSFLLVDGLSVLEEILVSRLHNNLGGIPLIGGSAGDEANFKQTFLFYEGAFHQNCAIFSLMHTTQAFKTFKTEHFIETDNKLVITEADCKNRIVTEINGEPAAEEYARLVGIEIDELTPMMFATYPVVLKIGGQYFVRSIQKVNDDGSLTFYCAIDIGLVLTIAKGVDILDNLRQTFAQVHEEIGKPALILGCDCILRHLELDQKNIKATASNIMIDNNVIGFSTYGEQFNAMHVNQTFTGIAIAADT